jgi:ribose transport system ATP-binding protein
VNPTTHPDTSHAPSSHPRLAVSGLSKSFLATRALVDFDLELRAGEGHAIAGQNGAGKSTLVRILAGAQQPDAGSIRLDGEEVRLNNPHDAHRAGIFTIHQELSLIPTLSVAENIFLGDIPRNAVGGIDWPKARAEARADLERLGFDIDVSRPVQSLPLANQQAVEIAKVMRRNAKVILLDEPTASLARADALRLFDVLRRLLERGLAIVYISHHLDELRELCQRVTVLRDGQRVGTFDLAVTPAAQLVAEMVGGERLGSAAEPAARAPVSPAAAAAGAPAALVVEGLSDGEVFEQVSLTLRPGEVLGVTGLAGGGQSELAQCLFGARRVTAGTIRVEGRELIPRTPAQAIAAGIALVPEERKSQGLVLGMTVLENMTLASLRRLTRRAFVRRRRERAEARVHHERLGIRGSLGQPVATLSGGNQQKVVLAKWLMSGARILILAEPTRGIDVHAKAEIWRIIAQLAADGASVLVVTSDEDEAVMCDRVVVLARGRLVGEVVPAEVDAPHDAILALSWDAAHAADPDADPPSSSDQ